MDTNNDNSKAKRRLVAFVDNSWEPAGNIGVSGSLCDMGMRKTQPAMCADM